MKSGSRRAETSILAAIAVVAAALASGCGGGGGVNADFNAANAAAPPGTVHASVTALVDSLRKGGYACTPQAVETWQHPQLSWSAKYQDCTTADDHSVTAYVFRSANQRASFVTDLVGVAEGGQFHLMLKGPNWVLTGTKLDSQGNVADEFGSGDADLATAQTIIGGTLFEVNAG